MIKGPWPLSADRTRYEIPIEGPFLTPMFNGDRVALRVSKADKDKLRRGPGLYGVITDLDTQKRYELTGIPCAAGESCYCDARITEVLG